MKTCPIISACIVIFLLVFCVGCESEKPAEMKTDEPAFTEPSTEVKAEDTTVAETAIEDNGPAKTSVETTTPADEKIVDTVAVTVNGVDITDSQIEEQMKPQLEKMAAQMPPMFVEQYKKQIRQQALDKMIVRQLLSEKVKAANIAITDEDIDGQLREIASRQQPPLSLEELRALIEADGQDFEAVKQEIRQSLGFQKVIEAQFEGKINITEDDAGNYFSENSKDMEEVRASHILIKPDMTDPNADPNEAKANAQTKAQNLLSQIKEGADFAELAKANSADPGSAAKGGDLGFFTRGKMVPPFAKAAFELQVGQVSDVVETRFGYHIIKVTERKDTFEQLKNDIINILRQNKQREIAGEYIQSLKAEADIVYHDPTLQKEHKTETPAPANEPNSSNSAE